MTVALLSGLLPALYSQAAKEKAEPTTLTGCLTKGDAPGQFVLTDDKTGEETIVTGPRVLEKHAAGHKVRLTGTKATEAGKAVFKATKVEHISATCTPAA
jgi:hypothetical protein